MSTRCPADDTRSPSSISSMHGRVNPSSNPPTERNTSERMPPKPAQNDRAVRPDDRCTYACPRFLYCEKKFVQLRFGLTDGHPRTLEEVGREFGVTRERIRQIESKTLSKLRHPSRSQKLRDYLE